VVEAFNGFKIQKEGYKFRYYTYKIENEKEIVIEQKGARESTYDDFVAGLPENDCRYGIVDLDFVSTDGRKTSKIIFIAWNPDTAKVRSKMLYSGSKECLKSGLDGIGIFLNATDMSELDFETCILPQVHKFA